MKKIGTFLLALMLALAVPAPCFAAVDEKDGRGTQRPCW